MNLNIDIINRVKVASPKNKRLFLNTVFSFLVKGFALIISLFTLPAYMRFFEKQEVLGVWFTALSVLSWVLTFDLGIGNGLRNHLVEPFAKEDFTKAKDYISSAYIITGVSVMLISIIGYFGFSFINWNTFFNISPSLVSNGVLLEVTRVLFIGIMLQFFLRLITSILFAMQKSAIPGLLSLISSVMLLLFVLLASSGDTVKNLRILSYFNLISANLPLLIATIILFLTTLKKCTPSIKYYSKMYASKIMILGGAFFWLQIMFMIITSTNEFLITWFVGANKVVDYKIYGSLFNMVGSVFLIALTPVWSEVTEAIAKKEYVWIQRLYKRLKQLAVITIFCEIALAFSLQIFIDFWLKGKAIHVDLSYAMIFAISGTLFIWNAMLTSITNGINELRISLIFLTLGAFINVPLAYLFSHITGSWISIILANIVSLLPFCIIQSVWLSKYFNRNINISVAEPKTAYN